MGLDILSFWQTKVSKNAKLAFVSTFCFVLLVHLYQFANGFPGRDSFLNFYADQNIIGSGRWALSAVCSISSLFDLPWVIGILSSLFLAVTAVFLVTIFRIENPVLILISGALLASAPTVTETFIFLYTADGYLIAMVLAAAAVYLSRIEEKRWFCWVLSSGCICVACGIYQAYVSLSLVLAVCYFMTELFQNRFPKKDYLLWVVRQACIFIAALASYYFIWQLCMYVQDAEPNDYQGIADVGTISLDLLKNGLFSSIRTFKWYFAPWSVATYGFTPYITLNFLFVLFFCSGVILAIVKSGIWQRPWALVLVLLCLASIVPFSSIWHFTSDSIHYRAMMLPGMIVLFIFAALLFENWGKQWQKNCFGLLLTIVFLNNLVMANIVYLYMNRSYERSYAEASAMVSHLHTLREKQDFDKLMIVGERYAQTRLRGTDPEYATTNEIGQIQIFSSVLDKNLMIEETRIGAFLSDVFSVDLEQVPYSNSNILDSQDFLKMPCWPDRGSVAVIKGIAIIKISDGKT